MTEPVEQFFKAFSDSNADRIILKDSSLSNLLDNFEKLGKDFGEQLENSVKNFGKRNNDVPNPTATIPPDYSMQQYLEPKRTTTLYNVTKDAHKKPLLEKVFSNMSYRVSNWDVEANSDLGKGNSVSATLGEHAGLTFSKTGHGTETSLSALHNIRSGKSEVEIYHENPTYSTSLSVFTQDGNKGGTVFYHNKFTNLSSALSVDENSASASVNWYPKQNVEFGAYMNRDFHNRKNDVIGVHGRITL